MQSQISSFTPIIWQEDIPSSVDAENYKECEVCTAKSRVIWGEGNPDAPVFIILDNPGERENKDGHEYLCGTRETLQMGLYESGIPLDEVYLTYILKCRPRRAYDKDRARAFSMPFIIRQIEMAKPKFLVCLGNVAVQCMFDDKDVNVKGLREDWQNLMGHPTIISYHPLAVRRRPNLLNYFLEGFQLLAEALGKDIKVEIK